MNPVLSVVIPAHNEEECIESDSDDALVASLKSIRESIADESQIAQSRETDINANIAGGFGVRFQSLGRGAVPESNEVCLNFGQDLVVTDDCLSLVDSRNSESNMDSITAMMTWDDMTADLSLTL